MAFSFSRLLLSEAEYKIYERAWDYYVQGSVRIIKSSSIICRAIVQGTSEYEVDLGFKRIGAPRYSCDCPYAESGDIVCKHILAAAIMWDKKRGVPEPPEQDARAMCQAAPRVSCADITDAYKNPLKVNLDILRFAADEMGRWSRPHAALPKAPKFSRESYVPLTVREFQKACVTICTWENRQGYDAYFCAGEMVAAFCETLRAVMVRLPASSPLVGVEVLRAAQIFNRRLILELIDDSNGLHEFTEAHLEELYRRLKGLRVSNGERDRFYDALRLYIANRGDY